MTAPLTTRCWAVEYQSGRMCSVIRFPAFDGLTARGKELDGRTGGPPPEFT